MGAFQLFVGEVAVDLEVLANALNDLEVDVVECGSAGDEVFSGFLIADSELDPLIAAQVVGNPSLAALVLPANPVAKHLAVVGIPLSLEALIVHETTAIACRHGRIGGNGFNTNIQLRERRAHERDRCRAAKMRAEAHQWGRYRHALLSRE